MEPLSTYVLRRISPAFFRPTSREGGREGRKEGGREGGRVRVTGTVRRASLHSVHASSEEHSLPLPSLSPSLPRALLDGGTVFFRGTGQLLLNRFDRVLHGGRVHLRLGREGGNEGRKEGRREGGFQGIC